jgi:ABC-type methionine transport system ATPase subunit
LLDAMTVAQNLAIPFGLAIDPIPADVLPRVTALAAEAGIAPSDFPAVTGDASPVLRAKVRLGRALALDPRMVVLEHPTATLAPGEITAYAATLAEICQRRQITMVALSMDEKFGKALGGRLLIWQPATGAVKERRSWF